MTDPINKRWYVRNMNREFARIDGERLVWTVDPTYSSLLGRSQIAWLFDPCLSGSHPKEGL